MCGNMHQSFIDALVLSFLYSRSTYSPLHAHFSSVQLYLTLHFHHPPVVTILIQNLSQDLCTLLFVNCCRLPCSSVRPKLYLHCTVGWRHGVVASVVRRMNEVTLRRARLVLGWVTVFGGYTITVCNQPTRSTQPCIPPGSLNRVPASAGVKAGMSPLPGGR